MDDHPSAVADGRTFRPSLAPESAMTNFHRPTRLVDGSKAGRAIRAALVLGIAGCTPQSDAPPQPRTLPNRPTALPPEYTSVAAFCSVPGPPQATPAPVSPALLAIPEHERVNFGRAGFEVAMRCVIRTEAQRDELWTFASREERTPPSLAADSILVLAIGGMRPSGGHSFGIGQVVVAGDTAMVEVLDHVPGNGCIQTAEVLVPAVAVRIPDVPVVRFHEYMTLGEDCLES
jgi:hypothetical protein